MLLDLVTEKRGLVLVAGATGSGKSTTLAAMIDHRNQAKPGHILTIEDPIEYLFEHKQSIVNQREIGVDTTTYSAALQNALREAPDLIMVGEVRDKETMQQALLHTLTGHLCLTTIHANNSYHALSRIINLFPYDARSAVLSDLSIGLRAIICQRLIRNRDGEQQPAVEILLNTVAHRRPHQERRVSADQGSDGAIALSGIADVRAGAVPPLPRRRDQLRRGDDRLRFAHQSRVADQPEQPDLARRRDGVGRDDRGERRPGADFATMTINTELLDRTH